MEDFEKITPAPEETTTPVEKIDVVELVKGLKEKGLQDEEIKQELIKLKEEGKVAEEELQQAFALLEGKDERDEAEDLFGMKMI